MQSGIIFDFVFRLNFVFKYFHHLCEVTMENFGGEPVIWHIDAIVNGEKITGDDLHPEVKFEIYIFITV